MAGLFRIARYVTGFIALASFCLFTILGFYGDMYYSWQTCYKPPNNGCPVTPDGLSTWFADAILVFISSVLIFGVLTFVWLMNRERQRSKTWSEKYPTSDWSLPKKYKILNAAGSIVYAVSLVVPLVISVQSNDLGLVIFVFIIASIAFVFWIFALSYLASRTIVYPAQKTA
jgi:hypothetical protein